MIPCSQYKEEILKSWAQQNPSGFHVKSNIYESVICLFLSHKLSKILICFTSDCGEITCAIFNLKQGPVCYEQFSSIAIKVHVCIILCFFLCRMGRCIASMHGTTATSAASSTTCATPTSFQYVCSCCTRTWDFPALPSSAPETSSADKSSGEKWSKYHLACLVFMS